MALKDKVNAAKDVLSNTRSRMVIVMLVIIVAVVLIVAYFKFQGAQVAPAGRGSGLTGVPAITSIPGTGTPTREYAKLQEQQNIELAEKASREGTAAMPTVVRTTYLESGASSDLTQGSGATSAEGCDIESLKRARASGVTASELRCRGCSLEALKAAGFTAAELMAAGFSAAELKAAGFSAAELKAAGFSAADLAAAGFSAQDLANAGFTAGELKRAGFSDDDLLAAGFSKEEIDAAKAAITAGNCNPNKLREARSRGVKAAELRKLGCSAAALRAAGYTAAELREAGFSAGELMAAGFSAAELKAAGFSAAELKAAGFSAEQLAEAGFTADELSKAGFTPGDLVRAGVAAAGSVNDGAAVAKKVGSCDIESLKKARAGGVSALELRKRGCSAAALKAAGFTAAELKAAGFSAAELRAAGFSAAELRAAGFSAKELAEAGFSAEQLKEAGFSAKDLDKAGFKKGDIEEAEAKNLNKSEMMDELQKLRDDQLAEMDEQAKNDFMRQQQSLMMQQANNLFSAWTPIPVQSFVKGQAPTEKAGAAKTHATAEEKAAAELKNSNVYKAGSIVFAVLDTGVNSDENSPVMATIVQGPLKGSKVLGNFQRVDKKVLLKFSVLAVPRLDNSVSINAVAVDPDTAKTAIASRVDNHYFLKYGLLFASSFVSGLGQAFQNAGATAETSTTGTTITMPVLTLPQKAIVAFGNTAQQFGRALQSKVNTPPTVKVDSGTSIGLLLMADLAVPKKKDSKQV